MHSLLIVGARPQFVKLAPLVRALQAKGEYTILHTGQHYDPRLSDLLFRELHIPKPDINLGVGSMAADQQVAAMLQGIGDAIRQRQPDNIVVFGDTNSTLAGALAGSKLGIPSLHIEAGLRSYNRSMPEEINRLVADHTCSRLHAPTATAMRNLESENLSGQTRLTGDIMLDALHDNLKLALELPSVLESLGIEGEYSLLTLHRPYNVDTPEVLRHILTQLARLDCPILFPIHPRTGAMMQKERIALPPTIRAIPPQGYLEFLQLQRGAMRILTDSGGIQKEAYMLGIPCVTLRPETEWVETVEEGWNLLLPPSTPDLATPIAAFQPGGTRKSIFGEEVSARIVEDLLQWESW